MFYLKPPWCSFWDFPCPHCKCGLDVGESGDYCDNNSDVCPSCKKKVFFEVEITNCGGRIPHLLVRYQMMGGDNGH